jgi:ATP-dependent RNA helicase DDX49/DBP8
MVFFWCFFLFLTFLETDWLWWFFCGFFPSVGRTARAGRGGLAITCVSERDIELVQAIEARTGVQMTAFPAVNEDEVLASLNKVNLARRAANLHLIETNFDERDKRGRKAAAKDS